MYTSNDVITHNNENKTKLLYQLLNGIGYASRNGNMLYLMVNLVMSVSACTYTELQIEVRGIEISRKLD